MVELTSPAARTMARPYTLSEDMRRAGDRGEEDDGRAAGDALRSHRSPDATLFTVTIPSELQTNFYIS